MPERSNRPFLNRPFLLPPAVSQAGASKPTWEVCLLAGQHPGILATASPPLPFSPPGSSDSRAPGRRTALLAAADR